jgi:hypothetical protein
MRFVSPRIGDVVGETGGPLERVHRLEVSPEEGFIRER